MSFLPAHLPRLQGFWLWVYRGLWAVAMAVALFSAIGATWYDWQGIDGTLPPASRTYNNFERLGLRIFPPVLSKTWIVNRPFSEEALASGIRGGDAIMAVGGQPVTRTMPLLTLGDLLQGRDGQKIVLSLRAANGTLADHVLTVRAANAEAWYRGSGLNARRQFLLRRIGYDLLILPLLLPSIVLFLRRAPDMIAAAFAIILCLISIGSASDFWTDLGLLPLHNSINDVPYLLLLMVGTAIPDGRYWPSWTRFSLVAAPLLFIPAGLLAADHDQYSLFLAPGFVAIVAILALRYRRIARGVERQQFRWVAFGLAAGVLVLLARIPMALYQYNLSPGPFSPWIDLAGSAMHGLGFAIIGAGFGVALLKYRLYDAESLISRSAAVTATTVMLAGLWAACEKGIESMLPAMIGAREQAYLEIVSAGMAVILVTTIHGHIHEWVEKRFHRGVYRLREILPETLEALAPRLDTAQLCERILSDVVRDVRTTKAAIVLSRDDAPFVAARHAAGDGDIEDWLRNRRDADGWENPQAAVFKVSVPLAEQATGATAGWLLVGPRPDGTPCNRDERAALAAVAKPIARAIAAVEARQARESRLAAGFAEALAGLEARLSNIEMQLRFERA